MLASLLRVFRAWGQAFWCDDDELSKAYRSELLAVEIQQLRVAIGNLEYSINSATLFGIQVPESALLELAGARELLRSFEAERARCCRAIHA